MCVYIHGVGVYDVFCCVCSHGISVVWPNVQFEDSENKNWNDELRNPPLNTIFSGLFLSSLSRFTPFRRIPFWHHSKSPTQSTNNKNGKKTSYVYKLYTLFIDEEAIDHLVYLYIVVWYIWLILMPLASQIKEKYINKFYFDIEETEYRPYQYKTYYPHKCVYIYM